MLFNKTIMLLIISVLSLVVHTQGRTLSLSQIEDIRIEITDDKWLCDMIACPANTTRCFVSKSNEEPAVLERRNVCYSEGNEILAEKSTTAPTDPKKKTRQYITSDRSGATYISNKSTSRYIDEDTLNKHVTNLFSSIDNMIEEVNNYVTSITYQLSHIIDHRN